jgi:DNA-binding transcriptional ArsR family regulator
MGDVYIVKELEQIKALSSPYRISIIEAFNGEAATAKHISSKIGEPHSKVNYHIKLLAKVGLLKLIKETPKYGVVEKYYKPVAGSFIIDSKVTNNLEDISKFQSAIFNRISKDFLTACAKSNAERNPCKLTYVGEFFATEDEMIEISDKFQEIVESYKSKEGKEGAMRCSAGLIISPVE